MNYNEKVTILIVNWNANQYLNNCIKSIPGKYKILIIDNASTDHSIEEIEKQNYSNVAIIRLRQNSGFPIANNLGLENIQTEFTYILNPDTEILGNNIELMMNFLENNPDYMAAGPKIIDSDGRICLNAAKRNFSLWHAFCQGFLLDKIFCKSKYFNHYNIADWDHDSNRDVDCISGCAMLLRTQEIMKIGGFDESVFLYLDDFDLCRRIKKLGGRIRYLSDASMLHIHNVSGSQAPSSFITNLGCEARYVYLKKHESFFHAWIFRLFILVGSFFRIIAFYFLLLIDRKYKRNYDIAKHSFLWSIINCGKFTSTKKSMPLAEL